MPGHTYLTMQDPDEALRLWLAAVDGQCPPLGEERIPLAEAGHRILSRPAAALRSSPAFHGAAMDGIAVRARDTFAASTRTPLRLTLGVDAFRIDTGRPLPEGCDAVVMAEDLYSDDVPGTVLTEKAAFPWQHVRKLGEDMVATEILLAPGTKIGPYELGALAAGGVLHPTVYRLPRVTVIPGGSEIVPLADADDEAMATGRVLPEFNSLVLSAMVRDAGGACEIAPIVPDDPDAIGCRIAQAVRDGADVVVMNAGSSAGSRDYTADVIGSMGSLLVHGVAVMPGKPTALGIVTVDGRTVPVIGTPGYPISAIVAAERFLIPLLAHMRRIAVDHRRTADVVPCNAMPSRPGMEELIRVKLGDVDGTLFAVPLPRGAGTVTTLSRADAVIRVPKDSEGLNAGEPVPAELLRTPEQIRGALLAVGSHDNTLDLIDSLLRRSHPGHRLTSAHVGSVGGLIALGRGQCHLAGSHLLDPSDGTYNRRAVKELLKGIPVVLVRLVDREQGLIVRRGNPKAVGDFADLARKDVRFVNRQRGSGTRVLLDYEFRRRGVPTADVAGYGDEEYTHMNVAAAVLAGRADVGLGVRSAAVALGLDFVPVGVEEYDLVIPARLMEDGRVAALLQVVRSAEFADAVRGMGGYGTERTGDVLWEHDGR